MSSSSLDETAPSFIPQASRDAFTRPLPFVHPPAGALPPAPPLPGTGASAMQALRGLHPAPLISPRDYKAHFSSLLLAEEWRRRDDVPRADIVRVLDVREEPAPPGGGGAAAPQAPVHTWDALSPPRVCSTAFHVPGVSEGRPYLEPGALVRLRPAAGSHSPHSWPQLERRLHELSARLPLPYGHPDVEEHRQLVVNWSMRQLEPLHGDIELRGTVTHIDVNAERVTVQLPSRFRPSACLQCLNEGSPLPSPATFAPLCNHACLCFHHACVVSVGGPFPCFLCGQFAELLVAVEAPPTGAPLNVAQLRSLCPRLRVMIDDGGVGMPASVLRSHLESRAGISLWEPGSPFLAVPWHVRFEDPRSGFAEMRAAVNALPDFDAMAPQAVFRRLFSGLGTVVPRAGGGGADDLASDPAVKDAWARLADDGCGGGGGGGSGGSSEQHALAWLRLALVRASCVCLRPFVVDPGGATPPAAALRVALDTHARALCASEHTLRALPRDAAELARLVHPVAPTHFTDRELDAEQRAVVNAIVLGAFGEVPYLLIGPAGSGKTRVLAESVVQLLLGGRRVLLCAGSEPATDLLLLSVVRTRGALLAELGLVGAAVLETVEARARAERKARMGAASALPRAHVNPEDDTPLPAGGGATVTALRGGGGGDDGDSAAEELGAVLRLNPLARRPDSLLDRALVPFSPSAVVSLSGAAFVAPPPAVLRRCRLVAASLTGGLPLLAALGAEPFDYVIVDESSQAMEPEALLAVLQACRGSAARLVLAGDPRQLGPDVRCARALAKGLGVSMQERLLAGRAEGWRGGSKGAAFLLPVGDAGGGKSAEEDAALFAHAAHVTDALDTVLQQQRALREGAAIPVAALRGGTTAAGPIPVAALREGTTAAGAALREGTTAAGDGSRSPKEEPAATAAVAPPPPPDASSAAPAPPAPPPPVASCVPPAPTRSSAWSGAQHHPSSVLPATAAGGGVRRCGVATSFVEGVHEIAAAAARLLPAAPPPPPQREQLRVSTPIFGSLGSLRYCTRCGIFFANRVSEKAHAGTKAHRKNVAKMTNPHHSSWGTSIPFGVVFEGGGGGGARVLAAAPQGASAPAAAPPEERDVELLESLAEAEALRVAQLIRMYDEAPAELARLLQCLERRAGLLPLSAPNGHPLSPLRTAFSCTLTSVFRCHQGILNVAARLFYVDIPLLSRADSEAAQSCQSFSLLRRLAAPDAQTCGGGGGAAPPAALPPAPFPIIALGVVGDDFNGDPLSEKEKYENPQEAEAVVWAVKLLLAESASEEHHAPPAAVPVRFPCGTEGALPAEPPPPRSLALRAEDIGVVAPFRSAVVALRAALREARLPTVSVGVPSVFQGQEKRAIIISTVLSKNVGARLMARRRAQQEAFGPLRGGGPGGEVAVLASSGSGGGGGGGGGGGFACPSARPRPALDASGAPCPAVGGDVPSLATKRVGWGASAIPLGASSVTPLGLFCDPRGFNVALTRAQSLLVCVGDPNVWAMDKWWARFLQEAVNKKTYFGYKGTPLPEGVKPEQGVGLGLL
jgi:hypothetical protein